METSTRASFTWPSLGFGLLSEDVASQAVMLQAEELLALSMNMALHFGRQWALHRGRCLIMVGDEAEGITQMTEALAAYRSTGTGLSLTHYLTLLAEASGRARQPLEGLEHLADAIRTIERTEDREFEAELYRVRGELLLHLGDRTAAEESYCTALAVGPLHLALKDIPGIRTESIGMGEERQVVIHPADKVAKTPA